METNKDKVIAALAQKIRQGYEPHYDHESSCDHGYDWEVLTEEEFNEVVKKSHLELGK